MVATKGIIATPSTGTYAIERVGKLYSFYGTQNELLGSVACDVTDGTWPIKLNKALSADAIEIDRVRWFE